MSDPIRAALIELVEAIANDSDRAVLQELSLRVIKATNEAHLLLIQRQSEVAPAAHPPAAAIPPAPACDEEQNVHVELAQWLEQHRQPVQPPAPAASINPDLDALLSPEGAYERGTGQEDGAQHVSGPRGPEWWVPQYGCDSLDNLLDRLRARILPHLRPPVAGIDVPGVDGDYGGLQELCDAEGVDPRVGVPLLRRARQAWKVAAQPPAPTPAPALDADTLRKVWREAAWGGRWATLADYVALAVEAQRAPSGNPPATEEYLAEARQEVAGFSNELLAWRLQNLARVQARDGREYSSALCARAAELIQPASDGEREELASWLEEERGDYGIVAYNEARKRLTRIATLLRQPPPPAVVPVAVDERPWEREGWCDAEGRCWWSHGPTPTARWSLLPMDGMDDARGWLLPHCAIPIPQPPQGKEMQPW